MYSEFFKKGDQISDCEICIFVSSKNAKNKQELNDKYAFFKRKFRSDGFDRESCQIGDKCTDEQYQAVFYIPETIKNIACEEQPYVLEPMRNDIV